MYKDSLFFCRFHNVKLFMESRYSGFFNESKSGKSSLKLYIGNKHPKSLALLDCQHIFNLVQTLVLYLVVTARLILVRHVPKRYYPIYKVLCTYLLLIQCLSLHYSALCTAQSKVFKICSYQVGSKEIISVKFLMESQKS